MLTFEDIKRYESNLASIAHAKDISEHEAYKLIEKAWLLTLDATIFHAAERLCDVIMKEQRF